MVKISQHEIDLGKSDGVLVEHFDTSICLRRFFVLYFKAAVPSMKKLSEVATLFQWEILLSIGLPNLV